MLSLVRIISLLVFITIFSACSRNSESNIEVVTITIEGNEQFEDGREIEWIAGANQIDDSDIYRVLIIRYYAYSDRKRLMLNNDFSDSPQPEMKGKASVLYSNPSDHYKIGLQVNDVDQKLKPGLNVVLISNIQNPSQFVIPSSEVKLFMSDLQENSGDEFFKTRILPYLAKTNKND